MAEIVLEAGEGAPRAVQLTRRITTIGRDPQSDLHIDDPALPPTAIHVLADGDAYTVSAHAGVELTVNGRRRTTCRLSPGDVLRAGRPRAPLLATRRRAGPAPLARRAGGSAGPLLPPPPRGGLPRHPARRPPRRAPRGHPRRQGLRDRARSTASRRCGPPGTWRPATSRTRSPASPTPSSRRCSRPGGRWWSPTRCTTTSGRAPPRSSTCACSR